LASIILQEGGPQKFCGSTIWQRLFEFCLLISVSEVWQCSKMHNLQSVGENSSPIFQHF